jgi:hypothetical protein
MKVAYAPAGVLAPTRPYPTACFAANGNKENSSLTCQSIEHGSSRFAVLNCIAAGRNADKRPMWEFLPADSISLIEEQGRSRTLLARRKENASQFIETCSPRADCSDWPRHRADPGAGKIYSERKRKHCRKPQPHGINAQPTRALNADGSVRRAPTFAVPKNSPTLADGDSNGYNANLYVY